MNLKANFFLITVFSVGAVFSARAQTRWQKYDSILIENLFAPLFSNLMMPKGYVEVVLGNTLLTSNKAWGTTNPHPNIDLNGRYTFNLSTAIVNFGASKNNSFNAGLEMHYGIGYQDSDPSSSPLNAFRSSAPGFVSRVQSLSSIGPRIKWRPFKHNLNFVYISTLQIPTLTNQAKEIFGPNKLQWGNTFLYSFSAGKKFTFFAQDDIYFYAHSGTGSTNQYLDAINLYAYFLMNKHIFPFISAGYSAVWYTDKTANDKFQRQIQYAPAGAGLQYQTSARFSVNIFYNRYLWAKNYNDWHTLNLGMRGVF